MKQQKTKKALVFNSHGFTLVELLVVLVITGMTTSLLIVGLGSTWKNFDRLSTKNLTLSQAQIPKSWFIKSINAALLGHPDKALFEGTSNSLTFRTFLSPHDELQRPQTITWALKVENSMHKLSLTYPEGDSLYTVDLWRFNSKESFAFKYLVNGTWVNSFMPDNGELPRAVRIENSGDVWALATTHRPTRADIPPEIPLFGKYEF